MDTAPHQWPQDVVNVKPMEPNPNSSVERKVRAHKEEQAFNCPRCNSTNTKFCYYNNYSLSQPRFFCKACRRYWTQGGSLRNIPVGGGSKKNNKRSTTTTTSSSSSSSSSSYHNNNNNNNIKKLPDLVPLHHQNPKTQELDLQGSSIPAGVKSIFESSLELQNPNSSSSSLSSSRVLYNNYEFMPFPVVGSGFHHLPEDHQSNKSSLSFSLEHVGLGSNYGDFRELQENNNNSSTKSLLFPFEDLKQDQDHDHHSSDCDRRTEDHDHQNGFWNGVIGGGSW